MPDETRHIVVIGSINMDLVVRTPRLPAAGETVLGTTFSTVPGGKGANQAVAAARLGAAVHMVGRVGEDDFGRELLAGLGRAGVGTDHVRMTPGTPSGCAMIWVGDGGENAIVVVPGANAAVTPADVDAAAGLIASAAVVAVQLEIPLPTVRHAVALCRRLGVYTILDPAPAPPGGLPPDLYAVDLLTPNATEAASLCAADGTPGEASGGSFDRAAAARMLLARGPGRVVLKLGGDGALDAQAGGEAVFAPYRVKVVDTTAAGDAFTAALAVARAEGRPPADAVRFANAAGASCCGGHGAQPALPTRAAVDALLARGG